METDQILADEFRADGWICPDVSDISILNYPNLYNGGKGKSFNMIINTCAEAARINKENNFSDYNSTDSSSCFDETNPQFVEAAGDLSFKSKVMSQNPA